MHWIVEALFLAVGAALPLSHSCLRCFCVAAQQPSARLNEYLCVARGPWVTAQITRTPWRVGGGRRMIGDSFMFQHGPLRTLSLFLVNAVTFI